MNTHEPMTLCSFTPTVSENEVTNHNGTLIQMKL